MQLSNSLYAVACILATTSTNANPIAPQAENSTAIDKRAIIDCGDSYRFTQSAQDKGYNDVIGHLDANTQVTAGGQARTQYLHYCGDSQGLITKPECTGPDVIDFREYPVFVTGDTFVDGMQAGQERVAIARLPDRKRERCGIISHRGLADN